MKFSEYLFNETHKYWEKSTEKEFLLKMKDGTLEEDRFKTYMIQDYYYLLEYKSILETLLKLSEDDEISEFLKMAVEVTVNETENVHIPAMRQYGITDTNNIGQGKAQVIAEYTDFYHEKISEYGLMAGLVGLLQCSWNYAYLGKIMYERYRDEITASPYKMWFDAYTSAEYVAANDGWIELVDKKTLDLDQEKKEALCQVFKTCAEFENRFWDAL